MAAVGALEEVLAYSNSEVVLRFGNDFGFTTEEATKIFTETKKWLWLCAMRGADTTPLILFDEALAIDMMWHTFILFTKEKKSKAQPAATRI